MGPDRTAGTARTPCSRALTTLSRHLPNPLSADFAVYPRASYGGPAG
jgi:hypothetical protein